MKKIKKYSAIALAVFGVLLMIYAMLDKHPLSLGQSFLFVGAVFFVGGLLLNQLITLADILSYVANTTNSLNSFAREQPREKPTATPPQPTALPFPPKTAAVIAVPVVEPPTIAAAPAIPVAVEQVVFEAPPVPAKQQEYFNDLAKYLHPKEELPAPVPHIEIESPKIDDPIIQVSEPLKAEIKDNTDWLTRNQESLNKIASDFPELDALLKKDAAVIPEVTPIIEEPIVVNTPPAPSIIREGQISGIGFRLFSDGTIEADFVNGRHRFASIAEFKAYVQGA